MIEPVLIRRLSLATLFIASGISALALVSGSPRVAGGIASGAGLGLLPILSWSILGALWLREARPAEARQALIDRDGKNRAEADPPATSPLVVGIVSLGKLSLYAIALFFLIGRNLVDPLAFAGALLAPALLLAAAAAARREPAR